MHAKEKLFNAIIGKNLILTGIFLNYAISIYTQNVMILKLRLLGTLKALVSKFRFQNDNQQDDYEIEKIKESIFFNEKFYLENYPDVQSSGIDPAYHFLKYGGFEGRNPSSGFDTNAYLAKNPTVIDLRINPLIHYLNYNKENLSAPSYGHGSFINEQIIIPSDLLSENRIYSISFKPTEFQTSVKVNRFNQTIKTRSYGKSISHWDSHIQEFWIKYIDRYYEFFILSEKLKKGEILDIGAEFYNKYIKEVIANGQKLTIIDIKESDHPDIKIINNLDDYFKFDMTSDDYTIFPGLKGRFDSVISFGVLSFYDITAEQCAKFLENLSGFLKPDGIAIIKIDLTKLESHNNFPPFSVLHKMIVDSFTIFEIDFITGDNQEFQIYYGRRKILYQAC